MRQRYYDFREEQEIFTSIEDVCSGDAPGQLYLLASNFQFPDPYEGRVSALLRLDVSGPSPVYEVLVNSHDLIKDYWASFEKMARDSQGRVFISHSDGLVLFDGCLMKDIRIPRDFEVQGELDVGVCDALFIDRDDAIWVGDYNARVVRIHQGQARQFHLGDAWDEVLGQRQAWPERPLFRPIQRMHGLHAGFQVAVGDKGLISTWDGQAWHTVQAPTEQDLFCVHCISDSEVYIGGREGAWRWNPSAGRQAWQAIAIDDDVGSCMDLALHEGQLYMASASGSIRQLAGEAFVQVPGAGEVFGASLRSTNCGLIVLNGASLGGGESWMSRFDGERWTSWPVALEI